MSESLAGRAAILELETLSWAEVRPAFPDLTVLQFMLRGGFPELYQNLELDAREYYRSYVATYLERDLRQLLHVTSLRDYERFLRACALRSGGLLNRADLSRDVGISGTTTAAWLSVLQATGQVQLLEPWFSNRTKSLVKTPKLYLADTGLLAFLCGIRTLPDLSASPLTGSFWETLVFGEIRRAQSTRWGGWDLNFWRDRTKEADFLQHRGGRYLLGDARWTELPQDRDAACLRRVAAELPAGSVLRRTLICRCNHSHPLASGEEVLSLDDVPRVWGDAEETPAEPG